MARVEKRERTIGERTVADLGWKALVPGRWVPGGGGA